MLRKFYEWAEWEPVMHNILAILIIFVLYKMYNNPAEFTVTNLLLLAVVIAIDTMIHLKINIRNNVIPTYFF